MNHRDLSLIRAIAPVASRLRELQRSAAHPLIAAIDGRSGAGKSTVATVLAVDLGAAYIPCDDFFAADIPGAGWDARTSAQRATDALDWRRLRAEVIEPLRAGRFARWRAFDFAGGVRADGTYGMRAAPSEQPPRPVVVLDGAYSARPELADVLDLTILVEAPTTLRLGRLAAREDPQVLAAWHARWDAAEEYYFTRVRPPSSFDVVLCLDGAA